MTVFYTKMTIWVVGRYTMDKQMMKQIEQKVGNWCVWVKSVDKSSLHRSCKFSACLKGHQNKKSPPEDSILYNLNAREDPSLWKTVHWWTQWYA